MLDAAIDDGVLENVPPRGLPRELDESGLPIPFAVKQTWMGVAWANIDTKLTMLCTLDSRCHICGEGVADDEAWAFHDMMERAVDGWVMHKRCAMLAKAHCPYLRRALGQDVFVHATPHAEGLRAGVVKQLANEAVSA
jgi:hypothetical protein